jgi:nucleoside-diphosphate-sugar epimerase
VTSAYLHLTLIAHPSAQETRIASCSSVQDANSQLPFSVEDTVADIAAPERDVGFAPMTPIEEGVERFGFDFLEYRGV